MIWNIVAAVATCVAFLFIAGTLALLWDLRNARCNYRCPTCHAVFIDRVEALRHDRTRHGRDAEHSRIEQL